MACGDKHVQLGKMGRGAATRTGSIDTDRQVLYGKKKIKIGRFSGSSLGSEKTYNCAAFSAPFACSLQPTGTQDSRSSNISSV